MPFFMKFSDYFKGENYYQSATFCTNALLEKKIKQPNKPTLGEFVKLCR